MATSSLESPGKADLPKFSNRSAINEMAAGMACILFCMAFNPFLALFFLSLLALSYRVPPAAFFISVPLSFALFFFFREYGVTWTPGADDDVPIYLFLYHENSLVNFWGIFERFLETPGGYEPLWHGLWWPLLNIFGASDNTFIFLHYAVLFFAVFAAFYILSKKYFIAFSLVYFFASQLAVDSITFLWRNQLAFSMFLAGVGLYMARGRKIGKWLIYLSPLMHASMIFFVAVFISFELYRKNVGLDSNLKFLMIAILNLFAIVVVAPVAIAYLGTLGLDRVGSYLEGSGEDQTSVFISVAAYSVFLFLAHLKLKNDNVNNLFIVLLFSVFGVMLAFPGANGIYVRFLMMVIPLYGLYFFRCYVMNFSSRWVGLVLFLVFLSGTIRMYRPTLNDTGVVRFLAFGNAFDPFMGIVKMLLSFWGTV